MDQMDRDRVVAHLAHRLLELRGRRRETGVNGMADKLDGKVQNTVGGLKFAVKAK